jgi:hypothetical protein
MHRNTTIVSIVAALSLAGLASASITVNVGTVRQLSPRPTIQYTGGFASAVTSRVDAAGIRTVTRFNLHDIVQQLGGNLALVNVRVYDAGGNSYSNWSPGADIDMMAIVGATLDGQVTYGYTGPVTEHASESSETLRARTYTCDAVSGDQHFNAQHFISLGVNGRATMQFAGFLHNPGSNSGSGSGGSGSGGSGGFGTGIGSSTGGSGSSGGVDPTFGGLLIAAGTALEISEAGLGEGYGVELVFEQAAVPAPNAIALLSLAGLIARRRR